MNKRQKHHMEYLSRRLKELNGRLRAIRVASERRGRMGDEINGRVALRARVAEYRAAKFAVGEAKDKQTDRRLQICYWFTIATIYTLIRWLCS